MLNLNYFVLLVYPLWKKQDVIFLAKTYQGNIGKIKNSSKVYLDYTLISLLLKNREARNEIGSKY